MSKIVSVYATFINEEQARRIGHTIVEERLAACVNLLGPCKSIYPWAGKIEETLEAAAVFKTARTRAAALIARVTELHAYEIPAVVAWPIDQVGEGYEKWVIEETRPKR